MRTNRWTRSVFVCAALALPLLVEFPARARPPEVEQDSPAANPVVNAPRQAFPPSVAGTADTVWFAEWTFDSGGSCDASGWQVADNRILNDGSNYWHTGGDFNGVGGIAGQAAILSKHDLCWDEPDGYGNDWDYAIVCRYTGVGAKLSFDYLLDSEPDADSLTVEADERCSSDERVDYNIDPGRTAAHFRVDLYGDAGLTTAGSVAGLALPDFGAPTDTHCVYIRFHSDRQYSPEDGDWPSTLGAGLVVDGIQVTGGLAYTENFEGGALDSHVTLVNSAPIEPFGIWARLYAHPTDNDVCAENTTCAWIFTDPTLPALSPGMGFGPNGTVVRNWLDNIVLSPWVGVPVTPYAVGAMLRFREFPGNSFSTSRIVRNWSLRGKLRVDNTDTPVVGDSIDCISTWKHAGLWNSLGSFSWVTPLFNAYDFDPRWTQVQVRFRVSDWQLISGATPPAPLDPGPGPYIDRVRLGRVTLAGPMITGGPQAVDGFASDLVPSSAQYVPSSDRFGSADFSPAAALYGINPYRVRRGDSIDVRVQDVRQAGGITSVEWHGAIVAGPHAGKAPPPWNVGANGFFSVAASPSLLQYYWFIDLDDDYFRGGDVLLHFWSATDAAGGFASYPDGLSAPPTGVAEAEAAMGGLFEVHFLPTIDWDPAYLARIAADPSGKLEPTPQEVAHSRQRNCILYDEWVSPRLYPSEVRRSGPWNRTEFMRTLDRLGYAGRYDVYSNGPVVYNNQLAGRASVEQATGYSLIIYDTGSHPSHALPQGGTREGWYPQTQWFQEWLAQAPQSEAGRATLWLLGEDLVQYNSFIPNPLLTNEMGVVFVAANQGSSKHPDVDGQTSFTWEDGTSIDFTADLFNLGFESCWQPRDYDALGASGSAVVTHRFKNGQALGDGAIVMNANPATSWNTVLMSFWWEDVQAASGPPGDPTGQLLATILNAALPESCQASPDPSTDVPERETPAAGLPRLTLLHPNVPNPFNPVTTIRFDLAREGRVDLGIYDVAGRRVRKLVDGVLARDRHQVTWDGRDAGGRQVPSGVYIYRLVGADADLSRKLIVLR